MVSELYGNHFGKSTSKRLKDLLRDPSWGITGDGLAVVAVAEVPLVAVAVAEPVVVVAEGLAVVAVGLVAPKDVPNAS